MIIHYILKYLAVISITLEYSGIIVHCNILIAI